MTIFNVISINYSVSVIYKLSYNCNNIPGFIFGVWNSHTSIGNILGSLIAGYFLEENWGLSFMVPGGIIASVGVVIFLFLVPNPADVGCVTPEQNRPEIKDKVSICC